jgi:hypothetical protein
VISAWKFPDCTNALPDADLSVLTAADTTTPAVGSDVVLGAHIENAGRYEGLYVDVKLALPAGLTFKSVAATCSAPFCAYNSSTGIFTIGTLPVGAFEEVERR